MSDAEEPETITPPDAAAPPEDAVPVVKPKVKKRRLLLLTIPLAGLALVSTVFGMMMAVAGDLPNLETAKEFKTARNSILLDRRGEPLGILTTERNRVIVPFDGISPYMRAAIISVEDQRFYENSGVDIRGIGRAFYQDIVRRRAAQGGSTITQQFVKNAMQAEDKRTVFQKLRESALAYHLTRKWPKDKILTEYLNTIYFGNGAYGIESAARVYFGRDPNHVGCGTRSKPCARTLQIHEAALLAAVVANPTAYDPVEFPAAAERRRNVVLGKMLQQGRITQADYSEAIRQALPAPSSVEPPTVRTRAPYFTTWVSQQLVDHFGARRAFEGGLKVRTTLDLGLQQAAQDAVAKNLPNVNGPRAAVVVIDNATGGVRAMVGGDDYATRPFNLATQGRRQPGSTVKPFILASALKKGIGLGSVWPSRKRIFTVPGTSGKEFFIVNNFEDSYGGSRDLGSALTVSDNSVYAAAGLKTGTKRISKLIRRMGVRSPVSTNPAMTLGAFKEGVSALDWAHAYESFATGGRRVWGSLGAPDHGPVGIETVRSISTDHVVRRNKVKTERVLPESVDAQTVQQMTTVVSNGTGKRAAYGGFAAGKTGTTENFGDAWFVGFTRQYTIAVWVGYPDSTKPMKTEYGGQPVAGGTFPAQIWHDFVVRANEISQARKDAAAAGRTGASGPDGSRSGSTGATSVTDTSPATTGGTQDTGGGSGTKRSKQGGSKQGTGKPAAPKPTPAPTPKPAPTPATPAPPADGTPSNGGSESGGVSAPSG